MAQRTTARDQARYLWVGAAILVVALAVVIGLLLLSGGGANGGTAGDISGVKSYSGLSRDHTDSPVTYAQNPPVGGPHNPVWQNCGIYDQPVPNEQAVHSLEHGAVWITYRPDLPAGEVAQLRDLVRGRSYTLLSPYPGLPAPVVASAWGVQLQVQSAGDPRLAQFIAKYANGPQTPERGAPCTGGAGTPISP